MSTETGGRWISKTANRKPVYHTDADCDLLGHDAREVDHAAVERLAYTECELCAAGGDWSDVFGDDHADSARRSLRSLLREGEVDHIEGHPAEVDR